MKKNSSCASVKVRLTNVNILSKQIIREKFGVGVRSGRRRKEINKSVSMIFLSPQSRGKSRSYEESSWWLFLFSSSSSSCPAVNPRRTFWMSIRNGTTEKAVRGGCAGGSAWEAFGNSELKICLFCPWSETHSAHSWLFFLDSWVAAEISGEKSHFRNNQLGYPVTAENLGTCRQRIMLWGRVICFLI